MKKSLFSCLTELFTPVPPLPKVDLGGKTILVIGANTGIGFECAKYLASMKPSRLILGCRDQTRGEGAIRRLKAETGCGDVKGEVGVGIEMWLVDLADFESVKAFVGRAERELERLDVLVLNAGVAQHTELKYEQTKDGFEHALQVNNIAQSLIGMRLIPLMNETAEAFGVKPRVVVVGSEVHYWGHIPDEALYGSNVWRTLGSREYCSSFSVLFRRYLDTKLLNMFFVRALQNRLKSQSIIVTCVNPGLCHSELRRTVRGIAAGILAIYERVFARKTEDGGRLVAWVCIGEEEEESLKGAYVNLNRVEEPSDFVLGEEGKRREDKLWDDLVDMLVDIDERMKDVALTFV
ncbi:NAD(P)-binding protein [Macrolepiota fuliginosa MF-IS2]|uniref:NAD(P)-binding protein n=1 Tax=Macrolepiota fuliginosa MF-IS2 TaxID=1400762 RepID=A0A9P6C374_9AGAR|nr:NAD(P)-binding protein [Macrolepiota fuliginosa MF-IS2]